MRYIPLSLQGWKHKNSFKAIIDDDDYPTVSIHRWHVTRNGYATSEINREYVSMHRFILGKAPKKLEIDHINRNKLDNRKANLRYVTRAQNILNQPPRINNRSGYTGVFWSSNAKKWRAVLGRPAKGKSHHLGYFNTLEDAVKARKTAEDAFTKSILTP